MLLTRVHVRLGGRFFSVWWAIPILAGVGLVVVLAAKLYAASSAGRELVAHHLCPRSVGSGGWVGGWRGGVLLAVVP